MSVYPNPDEVISKLEKKELNRCSVIISGWSGDDFEIVDYCEKGKSYIKHPEPLKENLWMIPVLEYASHRILGFCIPEWIDQDKHSLKIDQFKRRLDDAFCRLCYYLDTPSKVNRHLRQAKGLNA